MAFECPRRSSPPSPMFDADTGCIATDPAPSARRRFRSKTGIENLPANEHAQETPHTPSPTRTTRRIQSGCAGSRPRLRDGMPGSPSQHIDITRAKWIPYIRNIPEFLRRIESTAEGNGYRISRGFVEYYDPDSFHGSFSDWEAIFRKQNEYMYQHEYRFVIDTLVIGDWPIDLEIGDIRDISLCLETSKINTELLGGEIKVST